MIRRTALAGVTAAALAGSLGGGPTGVVARADPAVFGSNWNRSGSIVIGHRGAPGYRPEHTLASYELAARLGADFLEPDLVVTKDGVLVCRHEPEIGDTTDVASHPEFASRKSTKIVDGVAVSGWFTQDFTLAELKTLRAVERLPQIRQHNTLFNGRYQIPTFQELLDLRARLSNELGRRLGVYPETKHPTFFQVAGLPLEPRLVEILWRNWLNLPDAPVFVQSFEVTNLKQLRAVGLRTKSVQLLAASGAPFDTVAAGSGPTYGDLSTPDGLCGIARYAQGIGPDKLQVIPRKADGTLGSPTTLVADAHRAGLVVHAYTFRAEENFLPVDYQISAVPTDYGKAIDEQVTYLRAGLDGLFTDQADIGVVARAEFRTATPAGG
ncbi:MAG TPA: glycerophosphodiester phosphodiesterase [Pseudonocardiaceae bacterium]|nr:glycerophosphodiester phosphodiesterase [Pseudonocardiaceae bacterium]